MIYPNEKNRLYRACQASIQMIEEVWKMIEQAGLKDEQFVLDWLDSLNAISIRN